MLSQTSVQGNAARASSHDVRRAPAPTGRASRRRTRARLALLAAAYTTPSAVAERRRQASGVAVREHAAALPQQRGSVRADGAVRGFVLGSMRFASRTGRRPRPQEPRLSSSATRARPARARPPSAGSLPRSRAGDLSAVRSSARRGMRKPRPRPRRRRPRAQRHGSGARHADGGRAAHRERLDRVHHRPPIRGSLDRELAGQQALVDVGERRGAVGGARQLHGARETVESEVRGHGASFPSETTILTESARARREDVAPRRPTGRGMPSERSTVRLATGS